MKLFQPKIIEAVKGYSASKLVADIVAGIIVAVIALPLSIALAIASGVSPELGLYTAIIAGFTIALLGGSRVNISGPTAAFATIVAGIVATKGILGLVVATIFAGIILILMGICRFGSLIKYIPTTITVGFTAGIAVTIIIGQIKDFLGLIFAEGTVAVETTEKLAAIWKSIVTIDYKAILVGIIGLAILILWPMISKLKLGKISLICSKIPPSLIAVMAGILIVSFTPLKVNTIGTLYPDLKSGFPRPSIPSLELSSIIELLPDAFTIALLAAIESLLSCVVSDGMIKDKHNSNTELIAQGVGNICSGIFGGIPATGAIARTAANVKNGGRSPISGIVHAITLLLFLVVLMPFAKLIPMPIIAAVLFIVAYNMSEWRHFVHICKTAPITDIIVLVLTFVLTVVFDLVVAIAVGLIVTAVLFIKKTCDASGVKRWSDDNAGEHIPDGVVIYEISGPMFFAVSDKYSDMKADDDTRVIIVRMSNVLFIDSSAVKFLFELLRDCKEKSVRLLLSHVGESPKKAMNRAGFSETIGEEAFLPNIVEALKCAEKLSEKENK